MNAAQRPGWGTRLAGPLRPALAPLFGKRTPIAAVALVLIGLLLWYLGWDRWGRMIAGQSRYRLTAESLQISERPPWLQRDIRAEVLRDGSLSDLSVLDPEVTKRIAQAFELHTWVATVRRVSKRSGHESPRIVVDLLYRQPAIMVKTTDGFWPVDTEGFLLPPNDFSPSQTREYLRVWADNRQPVGPVGTPFGDAGILGAARLATALRGVWRQAGIEWVVVQSPRRPTLAQPDSPTYVLLPRGVTAATVAQRSAAGGGAPGHAEVQWGHPPGREPAGEATATDKTLRLARFVAEHGRLDQLQPPLIIDLRPRPRLSTRPAGGGPLLPAAHR